MAIADKIKLFNVILKKDVKIEIAKGKNCYVHTSLFAFISVLNFILICYLREVKRIGGENLKRSVGKSSSILFVLEKQSPNIFLSGIPVSIIYAHSAFWHPHLNHLMNIFFE